MGRILWASQVLISFFYYHAGDWGRGGITNSVVRTSTAVFWSREVLTSFRNAPIAILARLLLKRENSCRYEAPVEMDPAENELHRKEPFDKEKPRVDYNYGNLMVCIKNVYG